MGRPGGILVGRLWVTHENMVLPLCGPWITPDGPLKLNFVPPGNARNTDGLHTWVNGDDSWSAHGPPMDHLWAARGPSVSRPWLTHEIRIILVSHGLFRGYRWHIWVIGGFHMGHPYVHTTTLRVVEDGSLVRDR